MTQIPVSRAWSGRSIQARVVLLVGIGVLASLAILGGAAWVSLDRMASRLKAERLLLARAVAEHLDYLVQSDMEILQGVSVSPGVNLADRVQLPEQSALRDAYLRARLVEHVVLIGPGGTVVQREPPARVDPVPSPDARDVQAAFTSGRPTVSNLTAAGALRRLYLLVPIRNWRGEVVTIAAGEIDPAGSRFSGALDAFQLTRDGSIDVLDGAGFTIASTDRGRRLRARDDAAALATVIQDRTGFVGPGTGADAQVMLALAPMNMARWGVLIRQDESVAFAQARSGRRTLLWLGPALLGLALLFAWGAARSVRRPIALLTDSAERIAYGNLSQPIPDLGQDEVGRLGRSFEQMRMALKGSMEHVERANQELERRVEERTHELAGLYHQLQEREKWREELLRKVISAQEDERKRLARELHDETSQTLSALAMKIETALAAWPSEPSRERLVEAKGLTVRTLEELHRLIFDLRPSVLDDLGLLSAIRWYAERHLEPRGIAVRCEFSGFGGRLMPELETALFRVAQEAITNIAKHSGAETVLIQCLERDGRISIEIEDDGKGFSPESLPPPAARERGLGLLGMRERVELFGGTLELDSAPGSGTRIAVSVPTLQEVGHEQHSGPDRG
ncbi:MAG TPA: ATP-binding protein [Vicinamibacterales bacterium]